MSIDEILKMLDELAGSVEDKTLKARIAKVGAALKTYDGEQQRSLKQLRDTVDRDEARIAELEASEKVLQAEVADLQQKLGAQAEASRSTPLDLARSFRGVIDDMQAEARESTDVGVTIKTMDLEVKTLVEVEQEKTSLVLPSVTTSIHPNTLSTLRLTFAAVPIVPPPPEAAPREELAQPKPRPRRRRRPATG